MIEVIKLSNGNYLPVDYGTLKFCQKHRAMYNTEITDCPICILGEDRKGAL